MRNIALSRTWALAIVFGLVSIPWTYLFVGIWHIPLWPSFIASATYYATSRGWTGLIHASASILSGILYAALTLFVVDEYLGSGAIALSIVVGVAMFLASMHENIPVLSFVPGAFFGYATMFSVDAAQRTLFATGLAGGTIATAISMLIGAIIGIATDKMSINLSKPNSPQ